MINIWFHFYITNVMWCVLFPVPHEPYFCFCGGGEGGFPSNMQFYWDKDLCWCERSSQRKRGPSAAPWWSSWKYRRLYTGCVPTSWYETFYSVQMARRCSHCSHTRAQQSGPLLHILICSVKANFSSGDLLFFLILFEMCLQKGWCPFVVIQ